MHDTPAPLSDLNPLHPHELDRVVRHSLVKDRERQYQTAKDVRNDLDELKRGDGIRDQRSDWPQPVEDPARGVRGGDCRHHGGHRAVVDGCAEESVGREASPPSEELRRGPAAEESECRSERILQRRRYRRHRRAARQGGGPAHHRRRVGCALDRRSSATEIGSALGVATVLDGSVRRDRDRIRIVSQLLDGRTGEQLWSATYDRELKDIFAIQADVSREIAVALKGGSRPRMPRSCVRGARRTSTRSTYASGAATTGTCGRPMA